MCNIYKFIEPLKKFILENKPVWGICAGLIMLSDKLTNRKDLLNNEQQPLIGGLEIITSRNYFGNQINSMLRTFDVNKNYK